MGETLKVKEVREVARETGLRESQVVLSWGVQRGLVVLPKSVHRSRIEDNLKGGLILFFLAFLLLPPPTTFQPPPSRSPPLPITSQ